MTRIESLLRKEIGLDAASIGTTQIQRTVRLRMKGHGVKRVEDYEKILHTSGTELNELIEAVVVTETWFFRDREPFATFVHFARQWLAANPNGTLRALSVPCSSGEEPYSLSMALLDENVPSHRFTIDAVDISSRALARAQHAVYGKNSFRGKTLAFRDRHFTSGKDGYALNPRVRHCVRFHHDNLLGEKFLTGHAPYDFIFCRNLLIYFDRATQERALEKIHQLLAPRGILFVGPAELPLVTECGFTGANVPMSFACRKADGRKSKVPGPKPPAPDTPAPPAAPGPETLDIRLKTVDSAGRTTAAHATTEIPNDLAVARQLADAGKLAAAAAVCENHVRRHGPTAEAYYLLGLIAEASPATASAGPPNSAVEFYRKALYLEPNHYETLLHLALLLEKTGDPAARDAAQKYKRRAEKISNVKS